VDEENHQTSGSGSNGAPIRVSGAPRPVGSEGASTVAYYGDAARVSEGFLIALELLGLNVPMVGGVTRNQAEEEGE
jgi:hypothetical protein